MFHEQFEHQNVAHSMENERFSLKNAANTVDMAASSSKMLQIARKMNRTGNPKEPKRKKNKTRETNEPECSHIEHFCETSHFNSLVHVSHVPIPV